jgi:predicted PurR-regulated permease PerM
VQPLPRGLLILLGLAGAVIGVAGMKAASGIIAPSFLALVLMITVYPLRGLLVRKRVPGWLASVITILAVYAILITLLVLLILCVGRLAALVPTYAPQINQLAQDFGSWLKGLGVKQDQIDAITSSLDVGRLVKVATSLLAQMLGVLSDLVFIATLVLFIGIDAARFPDLLLDSKTERPTVVEALLSFAIGTRKYYVVSTVFGLIVAVIDTIALALMGIPAPFVWGVLAFVTNFIPNIGFVIGVIPPAVLGLLEGGPGLMIAVIVVYSVINFIIQSVIQPKVVGDALGLSTSLTFLSLIFWAFVLGPLGAILALPLTLLTKALLVDVDPQFQWAVPLLSGNRPVAELSPSPTAEGESVE